MTVGVADDDRPTVSAGAWVVQLSADNRCQKIKHRPCRFLDPAPRRLKRAPGERAPGEPVATSSVAVRRQSARPGKHTKVLRYFLMVDLAPDTREKRVRRLATRQRLCLIRRSGRRALDYGKYALRDAFGDLERRSRAFGFDEHGSPAASLDQIEAYLRDGA